MSPRGTTSLSYDNNDGATDRFQTPACGSSGQAVVQWRQPSRPPKARWRGCGKATFTARVTYSAIFCKTIGQIANRLGQKLPFRTGNRFQQKNPSFMHGKGCFAEGVDTFRGANQARHATPAPKRRGDLRGRGPLAPPLQTVSESVGYPPKSCNK